LFVCFLFVNQIYPERLNGFAPNSQGDVFGLSLGRVSMSRSKVKVTRDKKTRYALPSPLQRTNGLFCCMTHYALAANNVTQQQTGPFHRCRGWVISAACLRFLFDKRSLARVSIQFCHLSSEFNRCDCRQCRRLMKMADTPADGRQCRRPSVSADVTLVDSVRVTV